MLSQEHSTVIMLRFERVTVRSCYLKMALKPPENPFSEKTSTAQTINFEKLIFHIANWQPITLWKNFSFYWVKCSFYLNTFTSPKQALTVWQISVVIRHFFHFFIIYEHIDVDYMLSYIHVEMDMRIIGMVWCL